VRCTIQRWSALLLLVVVAATLAGCDRGDAPPDPTALVADLVSADEEKSGDARLALISLGEPAVPALVALLENGTPRERVLAATTIWGMGGRGATAVPALARALTDADPELRVACAMALENMGPAARGAAFALAAALEDPERSVRQAAVKALGAMGPAASPALPALEEAIERESWPEAEEAVRRIHGGERPAQAAEGE
jgi:HEAT repeat protein